MACHESPTQNDCICVGWLANQLQNNNIALRIRMLKCENLGDVELLGEQYETLEDTINRPKDAEN
jgi:hypothetical protein